MTEEDTYSREEWLLDRVNDQGYINVECASSFIWTISYHVLNHRLIVHIWDKKTKELKTYGYSSFAFEEFVDFVNSEDKGSYYNYHIKGR